MDSLTAFGLFAVGNARVLRAGQTESLVRVAVRPFVRSRVCLRLPSGGLAIWPGRGNVVSGRPKALGHGATFLTFALIRGCWRNAGLLEVSRPQTGTPHHAFKRLVQRTNETRK